MKQYDWLGSLIVAMGDAMGGAFLNMGDGLMTEIWDTMLHWIYETIYALLADFFALIGNMGADVFELSWVDATVQLFTLFGWALFSTGVVVAVFDAAIEYQNGRGNLKGTAMNVLKGFFACSLIGPLPIELYKFCISLQNTFSRDLARLFSDSKEFDISNECGKVLRMIAGQPEVGESLYYTAILIALGYCVVKIFFQNIKRGGILLIQIAVGALYMFSVPRGYADGFTQWVKQVIATCLTAFLQTTFFYLGLLTFGDNMLLAIGIMLAANEVPRIAQQFGLDSTTKFNVMGAVHATTSAVNLTRTIATAVGGK